MPQPKTTGLKPTVFCISHLFSISMTFRDPALVLPVLLVMIHRGILSKVTPSLLQVHEQLLMRPLPLRTPSALPFGALQSPKTKH